MNIAPLLGRATFADCYMCSQVTLGDTIRMSGIGVHNGQDVNLSIEPAFPRLLSARHNCVL